MAHADDRQVPRIPNMNLSPDQRLTCQSTCCKGFPLNLFEPGLFEPPFLYANTVWSKNVVILKVQNQGFYLNFPCLNSSGRSCESERTES